MNIEAVVTYLSKTDPKSIDTLKKEYPEYEKLLRPGKVLGVSHQSSDNLLLSLCESTISAADEDIQKFTIILEKRQRFFRLTDIIGNVISTGSAISLIAILIKGFKNEAIYIALLNFVSSVCIIISKYSEPFYLNQLLHQVIAIEKELFKLKSEYKIIIATGRYDNLESCYRTASKIAIKLNELIRRYKLKSVFFTS